MSEVSNNDYEAKLRNSMKKTLDILESQQDDESKESAEFFVEWVLKKAQLRFGGDIEHEFPIMKHCIYWAEMGRNIGSEEEKHRPIVIIWTSRQSPVCVVAPLTTQRLNDKYYYHVDLEENDNTALLEQIRVISKNRITSAKRKSGNIVRITEKDVKSLDKVMIDMYTTRSAKQ